MINAILIGVNWIDWLIVNLTKFELGSAIWNRTLWGLPASMATIERELPPDLVCTQTAMLAERTSINYYLLPAIGRVKNARTAS